MNRTRLCFSPHSREHVVRNSDNFTGRPKKIMKTTTLSWGMAGLLCMFCGCATPIQPVPSHSSTSPDLPRSSAQTVTPVAPASTQPAKPPDTGWTHRVITEDELADLYFNDPQLTPGEVKRILSRLNLRDRYLIGDDIRRNRPMKVPNDFHSYRDWSPLPTWNAELKRWPKSVLVVKDLSYVGWYEQGQQVGNTMACLGVQGQETRTGVFPILEKDPDHYSKSYKNSYGEAAWMPWSLRIYEAVWIHAGDITDKLCSHGCVTLPLEDAEGLFQWAEVGTPVIIVESLEDVGKALKGATQ